MCICSIPCLPGGDLTGVIVSGQGALGHGLPSPGVHPEPGTGTAAGAQAGRTAQTACQGEMCTMALPTPGKEIFSVIWALMCFSLLSRGVGQADCRQLFDKPSVPQPQLCSGSHWQTPSLDINGCKAADADTELYFLS